MVTMEKQECACGRGEVNEAGTIVRNGQSVKIGVYNCTSLWRPQGESGKKLYDCNWEKPRKLGIASTLPDDLERYVDRKLGPGRPLF